MLQTYHAEITGSHLQWLGSAPLQPIRQRVVVVFDTALPQKVEPQPTALNSIKAARGALGKATRADVLAELSAMREEWR